MLGDVGLLQGLDRGLGVARKQLEQGLLSRLLVRHLEGGEGGLLLQRLIGLGEQRLGLAGIVAPEQLQDTLELLVLGVVIQ